MPIEIPDDVLRVAVEVHSKPNRAVLAAAGAGAHALAWLLGVPGASRTVLEAVVPYGAESMVRFLGHKPARHVSPETARAIAEAAYSRALVLRDEREPVVGVGCTATIATDRPKRGEHRCNVSTWDEDQTATYDLKLANGKRDRSGEEEVVSRLILRALAESCGIETELPLGLLDGEELKVRFDDRGKPLRRLLGQVGGGAKMGVRTVTVHPSGRMSTDEPVRAPVLAGSFSPLHHGHERLAQVATEMLGTPAVFEISVVNADKPPLTETDVRSRLRQFQGRGAVVLTRAPRFREKAALFPGCTFVIGRDTAVRLVDSKYYGGHQTEMREALREIRRDGCRFLVAGRLGEGVFRTLADVAVPPEFDDLFEAIPESRFRVEVSSSELRSAGGSSKDKGK